MTSYPRSRQAEELAAARFHNSGNHLEESLDSAAPAASKDLMSGNVEHGSNGAIRRPIYWLEMRGLKPTIDDSLDKKGTVVLPAGCIWYHQTKLRFELWNLVTPF